jgi:hypothetical protein
MGSIAMPAGSMPTSTIAIAIIIGLITLAFTILTLVFITPKAKYKSLNTFSRTLADIFNFKSLFLEKLLKFFYIFYTYAVIIGGFIGIIMGFVYMFDIGASAGLLIVLVCILFIVVGPFVLRIIFEAAMLSILLVKNVCEINRKIKDNNKSSANKNSGYDI